MASRFVITNLFGKFLCETKDKGLHWGDDIRRSLTFPSAAKAVEVLETNDGFCVYEEDGLTCRKDLPKLLNGTLHIDGFAEVSIFELKFEKRYTIRWEI